MLDCVLTAQFSPFRAVAATNYKLARLHLTFVFCTPTNLFTFYLVTILFIPEPYFYEFSVPFYIFKVESRFFPHRLQLLFLAVFIVVVFTCLGYEPLTKLLGSPLAVIRASICP